MAGKIKEFFNMFAMNDDDYEEYDDELVDDDYDEDEDDEYDYDDDSGFSLSGLFGGGSKKKGKDDLDDFDDDYDDYDDYPSPKKNQQKKEQPLPQKQTVPSRPAPKPKTQSQSSSSGSGNKLVSINNRKKNNNRGNNQVYVIKPQDFNDAQTVTDYLREGRAIVINLEGIDLLVAQRVIDFIGGSTYALDGSLQAISANIFIAAPNAVDVSGDLRSEILGEDAYSPDLTRY